MRMLLVAISLASLITVFVGVAAAQSTTPADKPESSEGRTQTPETKGQMQPQGWTLKTIAIAAIEPLFLGARYWSRSESIQ